MKPRSDGSLVSRTVGVSLRAEQGRLRLRETATGKPLLRIAEERQRRREAETRAAAATAAQRRAEEKAAAEAVDRRRAEERLKALEAELARRRR